MLYKLYELSFCIYRQSKRKFRILITTSLILVIVFVLIQTHHKDIGHFQHPYESHKTKENLIAGEIDNSGAVVINTNHVGTFDRPTKPVADSQLTNISRNKGNTSKSDCMSKSSLYSEECNDEAILRNKTLVDVLNEETVESIVQSLTEQTPLRNTKERLMGYTKKKSFFKTRQSVKNANCRLIFEGEKIEIKKAEEISRWLPKYEISSREYIDMTKNCPKFIQKRGYITSSLTEEELNFPIAFSILMFDYVEQTERLLRAIYRPQNIYCIHVDAKASDEIFEAVSGIVNCFENVFTSRRINVTWGTHSVLEPDIICMHEEWNKSKKWKYFINLTGQEFPLQTNYEIVKALTAYNGSNDVDAFIPGTNREKGIKSLAKFKKRLIGAGKPPHGIIPMKGSVHIVVSRGFVDFVLHDQRARDFLQWASHTKHSSEIFFSSLHGNRFLNIPGSEKDRLNATFAVRYKRWGGPCHGKFVRSICIFGIGDLPILASRFALFANKFHLHYYPLALDCLEELLFNRTRDQYLNKL